MSDLDKDFQQRINELSKEKRPERDLWSGIELAIAQQSHPLEKDTSRNFQWKGLAASIVFISCVGVVSWLMSSNSHYNEQIVDVMAEAHLQQKNSLLASFEGQETVALNWKTQLDELDSAADAIKKALREDPNNAALMRMLQNIYQQQIDLIERVHAPRWQQI